MDKEEGRETKEKIKRQMCKRKQINELDAREKGGKKEKCINMRKSGSKK